MAKWLEVIVPDGFIKNGGAIKSVKQCTTYLRFADRSGNSKTVIYCLAGSDYVEVHYAGPLQEFKEQKSVYVKRKDLSNLIKSVEQWYKHNRIPL